MSEASALKQRLRASPLAPLVLLPVRIRASLGACLPRLGAALRWTLHSREFTNFTYDYTPRNVEFLVQSLAVVSGRPARDVRRYLEEARSDRELARLLAERRAAGPQARVTDPELRLGRQLAWYALTRLLRPCRVVETGVSHGLSAALVSQALLRNAAEGSPGEYVGIDLAPDAGGLLAEPHRRVARLVTGDSRTVLASMDGPVDLFISDSHVSAEVEYDECRTVASHLAAGAVIATTVSELLPRFAEETGRRCVVFHEEPAEHWFAGAWIGFAFGPRAAI
jgi:predicted O-methyltransferase YrrM